MKYLHFLMDNTHLPFVTHQVFSFNGVARCTLFVDRLLQSHGEASCHFVIRRARTIASLSSVWQSMEVIVTPDPYNHAGS